MTMPPRSMQSRPPPVEPKRYQIHLAMPEQHDVSIPNSAEAGTIIFTAKHQTYRDYHIYQWTGSAATIAESSICITKMINEDRIDNQAEVVKEAYANLPDTTAGPIVIDGVCQWFVMPACDVYVAGD